MAGPEVGGEAELEYLEIEVFVPVSVTEYLIAVEETRACLSHFTQI